MTLLSWDRWRFDSLTTGEPPNGHVTERISGAVVRRATPVRHPSQIPADAGRRVEARTMDTRLASNTRSGHRLGWVLGLTLTAYFMVVLDSLFVVSALPHMQHDLHPSVPSLQWTANSSG